MIVIGLRGDEVIYTSSTNLNMHWIYIVDLVLRLTVNRTIEYKYKYSRVLHL